MQDQRTSPDGLQCLEASVDEAYALSAASVYRSTSGRRCTTANERNVERRRCDTSACKGGTTTLHASFNRSENFIACS